MSSDSPVSTPSPLPTEPPIEDPRVDLVDATLADASAKPAVDTASEPAADAKPGSVTLESAPSEEPSEAKSEEPSEKMSASDAKPEESSAAETKDESSTAEPTAEVAPDTDQPTEDELLEIDFDKPLVEIPDNLQVRLKSEDGKLLLTLPPETEAAKSPTSFSWAEILHQFRQQLMGRERFWQPSSIVHLMAGDRLLDGRQLQAIADTLQEAQLQLKWVYTSRRQTAVVAATAGYSVEQITAASPLATPGSAPKVMDEPLYVQMTLRSGTEIRHNGTVIVLGDLNPGSSVVAEGDILVWGRLRGVAHAGCKGNARCLIMALQMEPTQIRIADFVARAPEMPPQFYPEVAYVSPHGNIRIARAVDFQRPELT